MGAETVWKDRRARTLAGTTLRHKPCGTTAPDGDRLEDRGAQTLSAQPFGTTTWRRPVWKTVGREPLWERTHRRNHSTQPHYINTTYVYIYIYIKA